MYYKIENGEKIIDELKSKLMCKFSMKDLGEVKTYLGINIVYDRKNGKLSLDQKEYINSLAKAYNSENSKLYATPMERNLQIPLAKETSSEIKYRNFIGALLYINSCSRPDISYTIVSIT